MPLCNKCNKVFKTWEKIDGRARCLHNRKYCIECSPFKSHNTKKLDQSIDLRTRNRRNPEDQHKCFNSKCSNLTGTKYCSKKCRGTSNIRIKRKKFKTKALEILGNKCSSCGYSKCLSALCFHHLDPSSKSFEITREAYRRNWKEVELELSKCILLCLNCHAEKHSEYD